MIDFPTYKSFGNRAILVEWPSEIDNNIIEDINRFKNKLLAKKDWDILDYIIGYNSLTIVFKNPIRNIKFKIEELKVLKKDATSKNKISNNLWQIPVCYEPEFGIDLVTLAQEKEITIETVIKIHSEVTYKVFFTGFLPGFLYLGGLDQRLYKNRKSTPRNKVPKGAVAIGGTQTGVYPQESPGGWNIIGRTPVLFFDVEKEEPCFAKSGDSIQFIPINKARFLEIEKEIEQGMYRLNE